MSQGLSFDTIYVRRGFPWIIDNRENSRKTPPTKENPRKITEPIDYWDKILGKNLHLPAAITDNITKIYFNILCVEMSLVIDHMILLNGWYEWQTLTILFFFSFYYSVIIKFDFIFACVSADFTWHLTHSPAIVIRAPFQLYKSCLIGMEWNRWQLHIGSPVQNVLVHVSFFFVVAHLFAKVNDYFCDSLQVIRFDDCQLDKVRILNSNNNNKTVR